MITDRPTARHVADRWVETLTDLDPAVGTALGTRPGDTRMPDLSHDAMAERAQAARTALVELADASTDDADDRRCATLLAERLGAQLAVHEAGEDLVSLRPIASPVHTLQSVFLLMPTSTQQDWEVVAGRMAQVPACADSYRRALEHGLLTGHVSPARQAAAVESQLAAWVADGWFAGFVAGGPEAERRHLDAAAQAATAAVDELRTWLLDSYLPAVVDVPDGVGRDRYLLAARLHLGAAIDPEEVYAWGLDELARIETEMAAEAGRVLPGASVAQAFEHLERHGPAIEGVEEVRRWLQDLMDRAIADLDGTVVDVPEPVRTVEARIAPPGSAAAPYYTRPSLDFSRPGRTWLPTFGRTRFPVHDLVSTWYHEGVPGHHLQLGQWAYRSGELSRFQVAVGSIPAATEGWALYAERLVDELGYLADPGVRLGYLDNQRMRAVRVVVDVGMHLGLASQAGPRWTADLGRDFFAARSGSPAAFVASEIDRYLGWPGQAISYKLGERAWLEGRRVARERAEADGSSFDLRAWHTAALSLGSLGLDDLVRELAALGSFARSAR